jgi:hypothetical protein
MQIANQKIDKSNVLLVVLLLFQGVYFQADDSLRFKSLVERLAENEKRNRLLEMSYVYEVTRQKITLGKNSEALESESHTFEVTPLEDGDYRRLIKKDGQPLSEKESRKEQKKLDESIQKRSRLSKSERENLEKKRAERRRKEEQFWDEGLKAFDVTLSGEENVEGRKALIFVVTPRASYVPTDSDLKILKIIQGKIWVDEAEAQIKRAEIEFIEDFTLGAGFVAKVNRGSTLKVWQRKVNDEAWFPYHSEVIANGRVLVFKGFNLKFVSDFANYRKFETQVNIVPVATPE